MVLKVNAGDAKQREVDLPSFAANTTTDVSIPGTHHARVGEMFLVSFDVSELDAGISWCSTAHCTVENKLRVRFMNATASPIDPATGVTLTYIRL
jgi:hypothetical protein